MGFFSFTQDIAMDLGTANTIITSEGKIVVDRENARGHPHRAPAPRGSDRGLLCL